MPSTTILYIGNSAIIELTALTNSATDVVDTGATVTVTLKDTSGTEVVGQVWPATMAHVAAGLYRATIDGDLTLVNNRAYTAFIEVVGTGSEVGHWELPLRAQTRSS